MRNNRNDNVASTTVSDMKAVAQDMLRMGKHWTQAAQDWLDERRSDMRDEPGARRARRSPRDFRSDYSGAGYDQVRETGPYGAYGARGYRGVGPRDYSRSDDRIREDLNERLTEADDLDASNLRVEVSNGVATIEGTVEHRWMKHRAEDLADACLGVNDVRNNVKVANRETGGGMHASGSARVGSAEVSGNLNTNVGNSAGSSTGSRTTTGTGTNTHQQSATGKTDPSH